MGVRHKKLVVEGVQFHPESILTAEGRHMLKNFLKMEGGAWEKERDLQIPGRQSSNGVVPTSHQSQKDGSILDRIFAHRRSTIEAQKLIPSQRSSDLQAAYDMNLSPPQISFPDRLQVSPYSLSLMAEVKRASPSKGDIAIEICAPAQAKKYALAGASVISVLTESEWFKGSVHDLRAVRQSLESMPNRPAILAKEFIFDEWQILEARLAGADTCLLIVKMLNETLLQRLYLYSQSLGMEPLVEVNTPEEMDLAMRLGAKVVGVNNRNLTNFEVDLDTTSRLMNKVSPGTIVCALSGISGAQDVEAYQKNGVGAVLVGEALMRAEDPQRFANDLLGQPGDQKQDHGPEATLVKICGTRTPEAARVAIEAGADLIGIILVEGRKRCVSTKTGLAISDIVHKCRKLKTSRRQQTGSTAMEYFDHTSGFLERDDRALLVGVFQNQSLSYVIEQQRALNLDVVQLHGSEPIEWASSIPVPVIRRFGAQDRGLGTRGYHALPLIDSASGGTGERLDLDPIRSVLEKDPSLRVALAGGMNHENVNNILTSLSQYSRQIIAVDVSSGVEEDGVQNLEKIKKFIGAVKPAAKT